MGFMAMPRLMQVAGELLSHYSQDDACIGIAIAPNLHTEPQALWLPGHRTKEPVFLAYSITKTWTATLLLQLQATGYLSLQAPLSQWFPTIAQAEQISLQHLLNHTSGIPDYGALRSYHEGVRSAPSVPWSFEQFAAATFEQGLAFAPGTGWAYSNPGYMLLKCIAEVVTGKTYADLLDRYIIQPLGLQQTFVPQGVEDLAVLAPALSRALSLDGSARAVREYYHPGWVAHGVVASTPTEIVRFLTHVFGGRLVSAQGLKAMTTLRPVPLPTPPPGQEPQRWVRPSYGLGVMGDVASPWGPIVGHNGGGPGYSASAFHAPELGGLTVCVMGAMESLSAEALVFSVFDHYAAADGGGNSLPGG